MGKPKLLYKYCTFETAKIVLQSSKLRWNSPLNFNDSFEFNRMPTFDIQITKAYPLYLDKVLEIVYDEVFFESLSNETLILVKICNTLKQEGKTKDDLLKIFNKMVIPSNIDLMIEEKLRNSSDKYDYNNFRVLSLTDLENDDIMWKRYADNWKGCVLTFKALKDSDTPFSEVEKVTYSDEAPAVYKAVDFLLYGDSQNLRTKARKGIYYNKEMKWSDESEWRLITIRKTKDDKNYNDFYFYEEELISITIGHMVNVMDKEVFVNIIRQKYPKCKIFQLKEEGTNLISEEIIE